MSAKNCHWFSDTILQITTAPRICTKKEENELISGFCSHLVATLSQCCLERESCDIFNEIFLYLWSSQTCMKLRNPVQKVLSIDQLCYSRYTKDISLHYDSHHQKNTAFFSTYCIINLLLPSLTKTTSTLMPSRDNLRVSHRNMIFSAHFNAVRVTVQSMFLFPLAFSDMLLDGEAETRILNSDLDRNRYINV